MPKKAVGSTATVIGQKIKKVRIDKNITLDNMQMRRVFPSNT